MEKCQGCGLWPRDIPSAQCHRCDNRNVRFYDPKEWKVPEVPDPRWVARKTYGELTDWHEDCRCGQSLEDCPRLREHTFLTPLTADFHRALQDQFLDE